MVVQPKDFDKASKVTKVTGSSTTANPAKAKFLLDDDMDDDAEEGYDYGDNEW